MSLIRDYQDERKARLVRLGMRPVRRETVIPPLVAKDRDIANLRGIIDELRKEIKCLHEENYTLKNPPAPIPLMEVVDVTIQLPATLTSSPRRVRDIVMATCKHYNLSSVQIMAPNRTCAFVRPRQVAMYLSRMHSVHSMPEIGRYFGNRDHTTVLHAIRRIGAMVEKGEPIVDDIKEIRFILGVPHDPS